jgi:hypothetical protein
MRSFVGIDESTNDPGIDAAEPDRRHAAERSSGDDVGRQPAIAAMDVAKHSGMPISLH